MIPLLDIIYVEERVFGVRRLKNHFVMLIICRPESRFLELIPREESEDSESAIPRLILKRQNTPSDDSTPPKVKYLLQFFDMLHNNIMSRLMHIIMLFAGHGPRAVLKTDGTVFPDAYQRTCAVLLYGIALRLTYVLNFN